MTATHNGLVADEAGSAFEADEHWSVQRVPLSPEEITRVARSVAERHGLLVERHGDTLIRLRAAGGTVLASVSWRPLPPARPSTLGYQLPEVDGAEALIRAVECGQDVARQLADALRHNGLPYRGREIDGIVASMPLVRRYSTPDPAFDGWALIFRDHYLEHSVGFVLGMQRAGIPAEWIYALDKGDRTHNRDRVHATFLDRGYRSDLLDNSAINDPHRYTADLHRVGTDIDDFVDAAHAEGRRVLVVDDGGLLARGYGSVAATRAVDAAIELTVSGIKRIRAVGPIAIPVLNMARSRVKSLLGYPEIADSCMRRLRALLPDQKFIGRPVLLIGYGMLGSRLAGALAGLGCQVHVVETDLPVLVTAAEAGHPTHRTVRDALLAVRPFVVIGTTGELALADDDLDLLPDNVYLAPFATRDFSVLAGRDCTEIAGVGRHYRLGGGRSAVLLGDGRSMNLFEADSIPNQGYDAYRAGTLIAAKALCGDPAAFPAGLHTEPADRAIDRAGLFAAYYDRYFALPERASRPAVTTEPAGFRACVVGYGVAGRLHADILDALGADVTVVDPGSPAEHNGRRVLRTGVDDVPSSLATATDVWSVCTPTGQHLAALRAILARDPAARVLVEKPACHGHEIDEFTTLLAAYPQARVMLNNQYEHSVALRRLVAAIGRFAPDAPIDGVTVRFTKDRRGDISAGAVRRPRLRRAGLRVAAHAGRTGPGAPRGRPERLSGGRSRGGGPVGHLRPGPVRDVVHRAGHGARRRW